MKLIFPFLLLVLFSFSGFSQQATTTKGQNSVTGNPGWDKYFNMWKDLFMKRNKIDDNYFNTHIKVTGVEDKKMKNGESLTISFDVKIDWMTAGLKDQVMMTLTTDYYPTLKVPRGPYLTEDEVDMVASSDKFALGITVLVPAEHLKFASEADAMKAATHAADTLKMREHQIGYLNPRNHGSGHPYLVCDYTVDANANKCFNETVDLVTGAVATHDMPCYAER